MRIAMLLIAAALVGCAAQDSRPPLELERRDHAIDGGATTLGGEPLRISCAGTGGVSWCCVEDSTGPTYCCSWDATSESPECGRAAPPTVVPPDVCSGLGGAAQVDGSCEVEGQGLGCSYNTSGGACCHGAYCCFWNHRENGSVMQCAQWTDEVAAAPPAPEPETPPTIPGEVCEALGGEQQIENGQCAGDNISCQHGGGYGHCCIPGFCCVWSPDGRMTCGTVDEALTAERPPAFVAPKPPDNVCVALTGNAACQLDMLMSMRCHYGGNGGSCCLMVDGRNNYCCDWDAGGMSCYP